MDEPGLGFVGVEEVAGRRTFFAPGEGEIGDFIEGVDGAAKTPESIGPWAKAVGSPPRLLRTSRLRGPEKKPESMPMRASRPVALSLRRSGRGNAAGRGRRVAASRERRRLAGSVAGGRGNVARWLVAGAMPGAVALSSGCVAAGAGAGAGTAVATGRGDRDATVHAGFERAVGTAHGGVVDVTFATVSERRAAWHAFIVPRNAADKKIEIRVDQPGVKDSRMKSRVGVFGDEALAQARLDKIKANR